MLRKRVYLLALLLIGITTGCDTDDQLNIIDGLDFSIATLNPEGTETGVVATTIPGDGRIVFTVDFGNPNDDDDIFQTSGPMVIYDYPLESAIYTITVTASLSGREDVTISKEHTVVYIEDPGTEPEPTPTGIIGTWKLAPESGAFGVGPNLDDVSWFSSSSEDLQVRDCLFDDEYVFNEDGTFQNILGNQTFLEAWQGASPEGCGTPVFPHDGSANSEATYSYNANDGTLTINGTGAYMGLAKVNNEGELTSPSEAVESITYLAELSNNNTRLELDIAFGDTGYWKFKFVKE